MNWNIEKTVTVGNIDHFTVTIGEHVLHGIEALLPVNGLKMLVLFAKNGYLMCRLLNPELSNKIGDVSAAVSAADLNGLLGAKCSWLSEKALALGATTEMTGAEVACLFDK